ncbi:MAG: response regulator [Nitrosopumilus sp.]|nr:response regulator [Nitrosopumilus sp.]
MKQKLSGIIIDDDDDAVESLSTFFDVKGHEVVGKGFTGCEAAALFEEKNPDFVILDMKMPKYDGNYAIKEIKKKNPNAKIFVITAYLENRNLKKEVTGVFLKPCNLTKLLESIETSCYQ